MKKVLLFGLLTISAFACKNNQKDQSENKPVVTVSILPQKYFVEKITGDYFTINVMIPPGASPVTYEPTPKQMKELSSSQVYFRIGYIEFEKSWMKKLLDINPEMDIVNLSQRANVIEPNHEGEHNHEGHHHGVDPHIWTSPKEVKKQVELLFQYFIQKYPEFNTEFSANYNSFVSEIDSLDIHIRTQLQAFEDRKFLIFHPALTYLARDYGIEQISIEIDGKEPTPANMQQIIDVAERENIKIIFVQQQFSTNNAQVIADEIKGRVVQIDPLAQNWDENLRFMVREIVKSYSN